MTSKEKLPEVSADVDIIWLHLVEKQESRGID